MQTNLFYSTSISYQTRLNNLIPYVNREMFDYIYIYIFWAINNIVLILFLISHYIHKRPLVLLNNHNYCVVLTKSINILIKLTSCHYEVFRSSATDVTCCHISLKQETVNINDELFSLIYDLYFIIHIRSSRLWHPIIKVIFSKGHTVSRIWIN